jgi:Holliday junction DNA helicase RuvA
VRVHTHVREDALQLYGFLTDLERQLFERLIGISGIGPRLAIAVLSGVDARDLLTAVQRGDVARLTAIPGIGKKTAERMVLELRDRAANFSGGGAPISGAIGPDPVSEATVALQQLGYKPAEAARMARDANADGDDVATVIRKALQAALR